MTSVNYHIIDFLTWYATLSSPRFAVMLTGPWGSGKTWLINQLIKRDDSKWLYVSLAGLSSCRDIDMALFRARHPARSSKLFKCLAGMLKKNFSLEIGLSDDASMTLSFPEELFAEMGLDSSRTVVFDDVERSRMGVGDVFGYVNQLVEHGGFRVVMIGNEDEMGKDGEGGSLGGGGEYAAWKEKVVGKSLGVTPSSEEAFLSFLSENREDQVSRLLKANADQVMAVYSASGYKNLRSVRYATQGFIRMCQMIRMELLENRLLFRDFVASYYCRCIELQCGKIGANDLHVFAQATTGSYLSLMSQGNEGLKAIAEKYQEYTSAAGVFLDGDSWIEILVKGSIPVASINKALAESRHVLGDDSPRWVRVWMGECMSDSEFSEEAAALEKNLRKCSVRSIGEVLQVAGILIDCKRKRLFVPSSDVIQSAKRCIEQLVRGDTDSAIAWSSAVMHGESFGGYGFKAIDDAKWRKLAPYVAQCVAKVLKGRAGNDAQLLLEAMKGRVNDFCAALEARERNDVMLLIPILSFIGAREFVDTYLNLPWRSWDAVRRAVERRFRMLQGRCLPEVRWLRRLLKECRGRSASAGPGLTSYRLKQLSVVILEWIGERPVSERPKRSRQGESG